MTEYRVIRTYPFSDIHSDRTIDLCDVCLVEHELRDTETLYMVATRDNKPYKTCEICGAKSLAYKHLLASQSYRLSKYPKRKQRKGK